MTKYYIDSDGNYMGAFSGDTRAVPENVIEVPFAPESVVQKWDGIQWK